MGKENSINDFADIVIVNINELVTLHSKYGVPRVGKNMEELAIINDGALAIKGDKIIFVGKTNELVKQIKIDPIKTKKIDANGKLVTPGFVDPHVHLIFAGSRENELALKLAGKTYMEILAAGGGIHKTVRETRKASVAELVANGKRILDRMLEHGTTTVEGKSGYGLTTEDELKSLEAMKILNEEHPIDVISTFLGAHVIPPEYKEKADGYVDLIITEMLPKIAEKGLAEFCDVFCEEGVFTVEQTRKILLAAEKYGIKKIIHIDEIVDTNGAALAAELQAVQTGHLLKSNDAGLKEMAKKGVIATLLPGTPFCLMLKEYANARKMIEYGIPVAIATDLNPNCWTESMLMVIVLSCYNMKMSPAEALTAATLNAACAMDRQNYIGSLEVGKQADIVIFDVPNYFFLSYQFGVNLVSKVIKKGKLVIEK
ncbi:MAG: imidazolonepropionase [Candidatus Heimdallarchaeota archaeon]|nr:imidazolonepropionase [Candidatus Heimdallarchaeota archaeon]